MPSLEMTAPYGLDPAFTQRLLLEDAPTQMFVPAAMPSETTQPDLPVELLSREPLVGRGWRTTPVAPALLPEITDETCDESFWRPSELVFAARRALTGRGDLAACDLYDNDTEKAQTMLTKTRDALNDMSAQILNLPEAPEGVLGISNEGAELVMRALAFEIGDLKAEGDHAKYSRMQAAQRWIVSRTVLKNDASDLVLRVTE